MNNQEHVILSERPEDQYKAVEWAKKEYSRLLSEKSKEVANDLRIQLSPMIRQAREARRAREEKNYV